MPKAESGFTRGWAVAATAVLILIAATVGLILSPDRSGGHPEESVTNSQAADEARAEALGETRSATAKQGFRDGLKDGLRHGRMTGRQVGRTDAEIVIGEQEAAAAGSEAASAQSELSTMSATPPVP